MLIFIIKLLVFSKFAKLILKKGRRPFAMYAAAGFSKFAKLILKKAA